MPRGVPAPTRESPIRSQCARVSSTSADLSIRASGGRRLAPVVTPPTEHGASLCEHATTVSRAGAHLGERAGRWCRLLVEVPAPAAHHTVGPHAARVVHARADLRAPRSQGAVRIAGAPPAVVGAVVARLAGIDGAVAAARRGVRHNLRVGDRRHDAGSGDAGQTRLTDRARTTRSSVHASRRVRARRSIRLSLRVGDYDGQAFSGDASQTRQTVRARATRSRARLSACQRQRQRWQCK